MCGSAIEYGVEVAPLAGARIEICGNARSFVRRERSLPSRERGLKCADTVLEMDRGFVAPLAGARIEISSKGGVLMKDIVAPLAGARIEIHRKSCILCTPHRRSPRGSED